LIQLCCQGRHVWVMERVSPLVGQIEFSLLLG